MLEIEIFHHDGAFTPGDNFYVHHIKHGETCNVGEIICIDREIPESVRSSGALGAEFLACPLATNTSVMKAYSYYADNEIITCNRTAKNEAFFAVVNHTGIFNGVRFLVGPSGELLTQLVVELCVSVVDVPIEIINKIWHNDLLG